MIWMLSSKLNIAMLNFHTAQLFVNDYEIRGNNLLLKLAVEQTDCKAKELCGVPEPAISSRGRRELHSWRRLLLRRYEQGT